jgi:hypothetical protein
VTVRQLMSILFRRWYIPLGLLACAALVTVMLARDGGIYTTRTVISFMLPASTSLSPTNGTNDSSIIAFAASVVQETNNGRPPAGYSMEDAPYYGAGIREGELVKLIDSGNQWAPMVNKAEIEIQIVGRTFDSVESRQGELVSKIVQAAEFQQAAIAVLPENRITASVVPLTTDIDYISASRSSQLAAGGALFAVAIIIGAWGSVTIDRLLVRRRSASYIPRSLGRMLEGSTP